MTQKRRKIFNFPYFTPQVRKLGYEAGFEKHFIRGISKMEVRCGIALIVMLGMAYGRVRQKQYERIRSLVTSVA